MDCVVTLGTGVGAIGIIEMITQHINFSLRSDKVIKVIILLNGPAPTLVYALICRVYIVPGDNPSTVPISESVKLTSDVVLLTLYCTSYCMMIPLGVSAGIHDNVTDVEWITSAVNERGTVAGPETQYTL